MTDLSEAVNAPGVTGMVYNDADGILYLSTMSGDVLRWSAAAGTFLSPIHVGGDLSSIALTPDKSSLLVGDENQYGQTNQLYGQHYGQVDRISLSTLGVTTLTYQDSTLEAGVYDLAVAANGEALFTTDLIGSGALPVREFLASGSSIGGATVNGASVVNQSSPLVTSDHGRYVLIGGSKLYDSQADKVVATGGVAGAPDISEEDGLVAGGEGSTVSIYDLGLNLVRTLSLSSSAYVDGVHFSADGKELFVFDGHAHQIDIFSTTSWTQTGSIQLSGFASSNILFPQQMATSSDGRFLFVEVNGTLETIDLSANPTSTPTPPAYQPQAINGTPVSLSGGGPVSNPVGATTTTVIGNYIVAAGQQLVYDQTHSPVFTLQALNEPTTPNLTIQGSVQLSSSTANLILTGAVSDYAASVAAYSSLIEVAKGGTLQVQETGTSSAAYGATTSGSVENDGVWSISAAFAGGSSVGVQNTDTSHFLNSGTFTVTGSAGWAEGVYGAAGTNFTNTGTFTVSGYTAALGFSTSVVDTALSITNGGDITVTSQTGRAVAFQLTGFNSESIQFTNTGTITAQTALLLYNSSSPAGTPVVHLTNSGTINGEIDLGIAKPLGFPLMTSLPAPPMMSS